ncbi:Coenzyme F420 hydrogenase/dehydrogenase, beta subunit C-terminal domain [Anaerostipes faecalis]|uniref:Coenzyme F420 hydrogenase/dehydrogenase, beta subunit C-terminal domain n=1 Tax=Anaerostipes faecalis TaxID=2738446 RepID=UPI003F096AF5
MDFILKDMTNCTGCSACYNICPSRAITMQENREGFVYPIIDNNKCINCKQCQASCPIILEPKKNVLEKVYAAYSLNQLEHESSSSGAIFAELARKVIQEGGSVWGAAFDAEMNIVHMKIDTEIDLKKLKGTKYVQSNIRLAYMAIKKELDNNKIVLFSGTPCQVAGLKAFLKKDYLRLLCIDLICHGVPSPGVYRKYLDEVSDKKVIGMCFRNKKNGIISAKLDYLLEGGEVIQEDYKDSLYIIGFLQNLYIRTSCFKCKFKGSKRCSDITIGDFWGIKEFHKKMDNILGVSAVIIHSDIGLKWFEKIKKNIKLENADIAEIETWNLCLNESVKYNKNREKFFNRWKNEEVKSLITELQSEKKKNNMQVSIWRKIWRKINQ